MCIGKLCTGCCLDDDNIEKPRYSPTIPHHRSWQTPTKNKSLTCSSNSIRPICISKNIELPLNKPIIKQTSSCCLTTGSYCPTVTFQNQCCNWKQRQIIVVIFQRPNTSVDGALDVLDTVWNVGVFPGRQVVFKPQAGRLQWCFQKFQSFLHI